MQEKEGKDHSNILNTSPQIESNTQEIISVEFPKEIHIAYAVCGGKCGNKEFIVDGETQVCECCGNDMFRTEVEKYQLSQPKDNHCNISLKEFAAKDPIQLRDDFHIKDYPEVEPSSVKFPKEIFITFAVCSKECGVCEFIIDTQTDICEYCGNHMLHTAVRKYTREKNLDSSM